MKFMISPENLRLLICISSAVLSLLFFVLRIATSIIRKQQQLRTRSPLILVDPPTQGYEPVALVANGDPVAVPVQYPGGAVPVAVAVSVQSPGGAVPVAVAVNEVGSNSVQP